MFLRSITTGLIMLSLTGFAFAAPVKADWVSLWQDANTDNDVKNQSVFSSDILDSDFSKQSFEKPFLISTRFSHKYLNPEMQAFNYQSTSTDVIDCKNVRYANQSITKTKNKVVAVKNKKLITKAETETVTNFKVGQSIPLQYWSSFSKNSQIFKKICTQTQGFDKDFVPVKDQINGWKYFDIKDQLSYVNQYDIENYNLHKPFILRQKRFKESLAPNDKPSTSVLDELRIDCKNKKYAQVKTSYMDKDYEYKPNRNPVAVHVIHHVKDANKIPKTKWVDLDENSMRALNICL